MAANIDAVKRKLLTKDSLTVYILNRLADLDKGATRNEPQAAVREELLRIAKRFRLEVGL